MNYQEHYARLIARAMGRVFDGYKERHHIIPRCMGGSNSKSNIVELTAEEHYVAHQLLVKMRPDVRGLAIAAVRMARQCTGNKAYGWLRRRAANLQRGQSVSQKTRAKISLALIGKKNNLGKSRPLHAIEKTAAANRGRKRTDESRAKMSAARIGKPLLANRGVALSEERRAKISAALTGNKNGIGNRGGRHERSPELRARTAVALRGRRKSAEAIEKSATARRGQKRSPEARARMSVAHIARNAARRLSQGAT